MDTRDERYTRRLRLLEEARWKRVLDVQRPYRWNLRRLDLGVTLDVGCGLGRNLVALAPGSVGVDHNPGSVAEARRRGLRAVVPDELDPPRGQYASLLFAHVIEHMDGAEAQDLVTTYLPYLASGGKVVFICPQERGYASDPTHVRFADFEALSSLAKACGLHEEQSYSFPFPRPAGRLFPYNEFVVLARKGSDGR